MYDITLNMVSDMLLKNNKGKKIFATLFLIFASAYTWIKCEYIVMNIVFTVILLLLAVFLFIWQGKRDEKLKNNDFYLVEDVFINVHTTTAVVRGVSGFRWHKYKNCEIKFSKNGKYSTNIFETEEGKEQSSDYSAVYFSNPGDKFYLLMIKGKEKDIILKCFNAKYYKISEFDFNLVDGKYIPKKV